MFCGDRYPGNADCRAHGNRKSKNQESALSKMLIVFLLPSLSDCITKLFSKGLALAAVRKTFNFAGLEIFNPVQRFIE